MAKRLEAAQIAWKMRTKPAEVHFLVRSTESTSPPTPSDVNAFGAKDDLAQAVRQNTMLLQQLLTSFTDVQPTGHRPLRHPHRQLPESCWCCGEESHYQRDCPQRTPQPVTGDDLGQPPFAKVTDPKPSSYI